MKRRTRREQILIGLCVLVGLVVGAPALWDAMKTGGPTAAESQKRLRAATAARGADTAAMAKLEDDLARLAVRRPPATLSARAAAELTQRAAAAGIRLREVKPLLSRPLPGSTIVPLQLMFVAPFPQAVRFMTDLRATPGRMAVDRAVISASSASSDQVSVNLRVLVFSLKGTTQENTRGQS